MTTYTISEQFLQRVIDSMNKGYMGRNHAEYEFVVNRLKSLKPNTQEPLTDEQYDELITQVTQNVPFSWRDFARAVEQAHGIGVKP